MAESSEISTARIADTEFLVRRSMTTGYQLLSLLTPPVYTASVLFRYGRGHFSVNRLLRATWVGGAVGVASGAAVEYLRASNSSSETLHHRSIRAAYNVFETSSLRIDDHSTIGAILFAVLTPALFWRRARIPHLILGGAGLGSSAGVLVHYGRTMSGDSPPRIQIPQVPVSA